jgi:hypothetical protein
MIGFDPLSLSAAYILAGMTAAQCPQQGPVSVEVHLTVNESPYVTNMTAVEMNKSFKGDVNSTLSSDRWIIDGLTSSKFTSSLSGKYATVTIPRTGETCFALTKITYEITYTPVIYVASDFKGMACRHAVVLNHEKHHKDTAVRTITDYMPDMKRALERVTSNLIPQGPYAQTEVKDRIDALFKQISDAVQPAWEEMNELNRKRQAEIDTEANYRRETAMCPGQFPKFDGSQ